MIESIGNITGAIDSKQELISDINQNEELIGEIGVGTFTIHYDDYEDLKNKPKINGVELKGDLTSEDLDISSNLIAGNNIEIKDNVISVLTAPNVEKDNTKPITSSAVYTEVGNIKVLLETI